MTESADELWGRLLSEPKSESAGQSAIDSRGESASHLQDESASDSYNDSSNEMPDADASTGSISVRPSESRSGSDTERSDDNSKAGRGDAGSDVMTFALSDAKSDE